uniref:RING finger protein 227-like n=1 Tax=Pristiophorus japonicus TaxID=55135 RepID=UPI00398F1C55
MQADGECGICYCPYTRGSRTPRLLPCRHALCSRCLLTLLGRARPDPSGHRRLLCPFCRGPASARLEGTEPPFPLDPGAWERVLARGPETEDEETKGPAATALKREVKQWTERLRRGLSLRRRSHSTPGAVCVDMRDMVLLASFQLI